jgi:hypothetical protein
MRQYQAKLELYAKPGLPAVRQTLQEARDLVEAQRAQQPQQAQQGAASGEAHVGQLSASGASGEPAGQVQQAERDGTCGTASAVGPPVAEGQQGGSGQEEAPDAHSGSHPLGQQQPQESGWQPHADSSLGGGAGATRQEQQLKRQRQA